MSGSAVVALDRPSPALDTLGERPDVHGCRVRSIARPTAPFDRAEARDFAGVRALADRYGTARLLDLAAGVDAGFDIAVFADLLDSLTRFDDAETVPV